MLPVILHSMVCRSSRSTLFPYTTLFRSLLGATGVVGPEVDRGGGLDVGEVEVELLLVPALPDAGAAAGRQAQRSEEHTSELQSRGHLVCRLLLEKKKENAQIERIEKRD